tara:strand:+ start:341 stop:970 length:630 start_codon:yes stop_codon:yes gene_type:complete
MINPENIIFSGTESISTEDISDITSLKLPTRLIFIRTKLIERELKKNLSLKQISVTRQIFPFGLKIDLQSRNPVAFAIREEKGISIKGYVDNEGEFIKEKYFDNKENIIFPVKVFGWNEKYKIYISKIFKAYKNNNDLMVINIDTNGFIILKERELQEIFLGYISRDIDYKLNLILDIKNQLNKQKLSKKIKSLDLTDLSNPKLKVFIP